jgi:thiol-disulfide isomerase/thioredoxin
MRSALPLVVILCACGQQVPAPTIGQPVPEVVLPDLEGRTVRLSDFHGDVVVLNFWATWCPPCIDEMPSLEKLQRALGEKGLHVLAAAVDENLEDVARFREEYELSLPILHDRGGKTAHSFSTFKYPETYVVGRDGRLVAKVIGPRDWISPTVIREFVQLLRVEEGDGI